MKMMIVKQIRYSDQTEPIVVVYHTTGARFCVSIRAVAHRHGMDADMMVGCIVDLIQVSIEVEDDLEILCDRWGHGH
jgi:hypothetical protein